MTRVLPEYLLSIRVFFLGCRLPFLASESGSLPKYTNQSSPFNILQPKMETLLSITQILDAKWTL
jgi:hypothetical protein